MLLVSILVVILLRGSDGFNIPGIGSLFDLDGYYELTKEVVSKGQFAADRGEPINLFDDRCEVMLGELLNKVDELSEKIDLINNRIISKLDDLEHLVRGIADDVQKKFLMHKVIDSMKIVFEKHDEFIQFSKKKKIPKKKFIKFLQNVVSSGSEGVEEELKKIHRIIVRGKRTSAIEQTVLDVLENVLNAKNEERCDENSPQHSLYLIYTVIATAELTGFTTIVYAAKLLEKETKNNETDMEIAFVTESIHARMKNYVESFKESMGRVSRMYRMCDPEKNGHVRGKTFTEMWGLIQVMIMYEKSITQSSRCDSTCEAMWGNRGYEENCYRDLVSHTRWDRFRPDRFDVCPSPRKCFGLIHSCKSLWNGNFCKLKFGPRRYQFIQDSYDGGKMYGVWKNCVDRNEVYTHADFQVGMAYTNCANCVCVCNDDDPQSHSTHIISLKESISRYKENKVVIGMRFVEELFVLHIQVREAEIGREFSIKRGTEKWKYLPKLGVEIELSSKPADPWARGPQRAPLQEGKDYHMFKADHAFNMNEVLLKDNRVVVGCRFAKSERKEILDAHIEVEVKSMAYNPATGKLIQGTEQWEKSTVIHDSKIDVDNKLPQNADSKTTLRSKSNDYVQMRESNWEEDAGQTTLPLFDGHDVEARPLSPMSGIGMHYRAAHEHSGFIGLSAYSFDYVAFLDNSGNNQSPDPNDVRGPE